MVENISLKFPRAYTRYEQEYRKYAMHVAVKNLCRCARERARRFLLFYPFSFSLSSLLPHERTFAYVYRSLYYLCAGYLITAVTSHVTLISYQFLSLSFSLRLSVISL